MAGGVCVCVCVCVCVGGGDYSREAINRGTAIITQTRYEVLGLNVKLNEVQFFVLPAIFHTLPLFYLRT